MLQQIDHALPRLSRAERTVAEWILEHPRDTTTATIADIAGATGISEPTVVRFCRSMGADGFRDFKLRLAESVGRSGSVVHRDVGPDDSVELAVLKVIDGSIQALGEIRERARNLPFPEAVELLVTARQIVFAGLGASGQVANDACQKFFRLGTPCSAATDTPTLLQMGAIAESEDLFIAVSETGSWPGMVRAMRSARDNGAAVIALTRPDSPLARSATLVFESRAAEDTSVYTPMSTRLAQLAVLDALQVAMAIRLGPSAERRLRASKEALLD